MAVARRGVAVSANLGITTSAFTSLHQYQAPHRPRHTITVTETERTIDRKCTVMDEGVAGHEAGDGSFEEAMFD